MFKKRKIGTIILILLLLLNSTATAAAWNPAGNRQAVESISRALDYLAAAQNSDGGFPGQKGQKSSVTVTEWVIMALCAAGENPETGKWVEKGSSPLAYLQSAYFSPEESQSKVQRATNDYSRSILALSAYGKGSTAQVSELAERIKGFQQDNGQFAQPELGELDLVNVHMWAVIALASTGQEIPNREKVLAWLTARQNSDGGFSWFAGGDSDPDDTGVALAVMVLLGEARDARVVRGALSYLKKQQDESGGLSWTGQECNSATDAWVLQGLFAAGEDPEETKWQVNEASILTHLLSLQNDSGYFNWTKQTCSSPVMMTANALIALSGKSFPVNLDFSCLNSNTGLNDHSHRFSDLQRADVRGKYGEVRDEDPEDIFGYFFSFWHTGGQFMARYSFSTNKLGGLISNGAWISLNWVFPSF